MDAKIVKKGWLLRSIEVNIGKLPTEITYSGRGFGYERILINGVVKSKQSSKAWYVPKFELNHNDKSILIQVRVWPWLSIRSLRISVESELVYQEGAEPYKVTTLSELLHVVIFYSMLFGPIFLIGYLMDYVNV